MNTATSFITVTDSNKMLVQLYLLKAILETAVAADDAFPTFSPHISRQLNCIFGDEAFSNENFISQPMPSGNNTQTPGGDPQHRGNNSTKVAIDNPETITDLFQPFTGPHFETDSFQSFTGPDFGTTEPTVDVNNLRYYCTKCNYTEQECNCKNLELICNITGEETPLVTEFNCKKWEHVTKAVFNVFFGVLGLIGNFLVMLITFLDRKTSTRCQFLIAGLAAVDFVFSIGQTIVNFPELWTCHWLYGHAMCKLVHAFTNLGFMVALGFILLIALERFNGIVFPLSTWLTKKVIWLLTILNIVLGIAMTIPNAIETTTVVDSYGNVFCKETFSKTASRIYTLVTFFVYFIIPIAIAGSFYAIIIIKLYTSYASTLASLSDPQRLKRVRDNKRIVTILVSILVAFFVLVLPNRLVWIYFDFADQPSSNTHSILTLIGFIPYSIHVAINPIVYSMIDVKFQKKMKSLLSRVLSRSTKADNTYSFNTSSSELHDVTVRNLRKISKDSLTAIKD